MRRYLILSLSLVLTLALVALPAAAADQPVKVYILSGQSNMVGIGQVGPAGMTRYDTYVSADKDAEQGSTLSIYRGDYDPSVDYDKQEPIETHHVRLGYWPHKAFPAVDEPCTHMALGFIRIDRPGRYSFKTTGGSILELDGTAIYRDMPDQEPINKIVQLKPGTYPLKVTYMLVGEALGKGILKLRKTGNTP